jgi:hypothetical protein
MENARQVQHFWDEHPGVTVTPFQWKPVVAMCLRCGMTLDQFKDTRQPCHLPVVRGSAAHIEVAKHYK